MCSWDFLLLRFIYVFMAVLGSSQAHEFSLSCSKQGSASPTMIHMFLIYCGLSCCRTQALSTLASVVAVHELSSCGSSAPEHRPRIGCTGLIWHVGSSHIRDQTCVSCIGRWTPPHWATRETRDFLFILQDNHAFDSCSAFSIY